MSLNLDKIIGNGIPNVLRINPQNQKIEAARLLNVAETLEENIEDTQRFSTSLGEPLRGSNIDIFGWPIIIRLF